MIISKIRVRFGLRNCIYSTGVQWSIYRLLQRKETTMAFVVTAPCFGCKYTDCVVVCPCDCFREGESMLYIDPDECIDCYACVPECPVEAIFHEDEVPEDQREFISLNAELARVCPPILERKPPLAGSS